MLSEKQAKRERRIQIGRRILEHRIHIACQSPTYNLIDHIWSRESDPPTYLHELVFKYKAREKKKEMLEVWLSMIQFYDGRS
jgi:hypothetical protein